MVHVLHLLVVHDLLHLLEDGVVLCFQSCLVDAQLALFVDKGLVLHLDLVYEVLELRLQLLMKLLLLNGRVTANNSILICLQL